MHEINHKHQMNTSNFENDTYQQVPDLQVYLQSNSLIA